MTASEQPFERRRWNARAEPASPRVSFEELEIRAADGASLRARALEPPPDRPLRGTIVLAHASFGDKSSFGGNDGEGLANDLAASGLRAVAFDFRGHGDSAGSFDFDDVVRRDLPAVVECARARAEDRPVVVVGHSLGGVAALAAQGTGRIRADALVVVGATVWLRAFEPSRARWAMKRALAAVFSSSGGRPNGPGGRGGAESGRGGALLRRLLHEASAHGLAELVRPVRENAWVSTDRREDYAAALAQVRVPVAAVFGEHDHVICPRAAGTAFVRATGGKLALFDAPSGHRALCSDPAARRVVADAVEWSIAAASRAVA